MAKRASLTFDALKGSKGAQPPAEPHEALREPETGAKRGRGRPPVRDPDAKVYGMTLRIPGELRIALRREAEAQTAAQGRVVSVHDVILSAIESRLGRPPSRA